MLTKKFPEAWIVYADGAVSPGRASGIGIVMFDPAASEKPLCFGNTLSIRTNQAAEISAAIIALAKIAAGSEVRIITDSMYVVGTMTLNWKRKFNHNLWAALEEQVKRMKQVAFEHVRGHQGNRWNEEADKIAVARKGLKVDYELPVS